MANKLTIENDRQYFWQWDVGQRLVVTDSDCREVHFYNGGEGALKQDVYTEDGIAYVDVPDILLGNARGLDAFLFIATSNEAHTMMHQHIDIRPRPRPLEYACTPTEILSWRTMDAKMDELLEELSQSDYTAVQNSLKEISNELTTNSQQHEAMEMEIAEIDGKMQWKVSTGLITDSRSCSTDEDIRNAMEEFFQASVSGGLTCFSISVDSTDVSIPFHIGRFALMIFRDSGNAGDYGLCMLVDTATSLGSLVCRRGEYGWENRWEYRGVTPTKGVDYWTAEDKAEMVADVIAALPVYNGEVL